MYPPDTYQEGGEDKPAKSIEEEMKQRQTPLDILAVEAAEKIDELVGEKKFLQQQCDDLGKALTKEQLANADMLEALEELMEWETLLMAVLPAVGIDLSKQKAAIAKAKA